MIASLAFPIGATLDMLPGIAAMSLFQPLLQEDDLATQVFGIVGTTLTQGLLLNVVLAAFIGFIYAVFVLSRSDIFRPGGRNY